MSKQGGANAGALIRLAKDRVTLCSGRLGDLCGNGFGQRTRTLAADAQDDLGRVANELQAALHLLEAPLPEPAPGLAITSVHYEAVRNVGNYENKRMRASANVGATEDAGEVLQKLAQWVEDELDKVSHTTEEIRDLDRQVRELEYKREDAEAAAERALANVQKLRAWLSHHGLDRFGGLPEPPAPVDDRPERADGEDDPDDDKGADDDIPF